MRGFITVPEQIRKLASVCLKLGRHGDFPLTYHKLIVDVLTRFGPIKLLCANLRVVVVVGVTLAQRFLSVPQSREIWTRRQTVRLISKRTRGKKTLCILEQIGGIFIIFNSSYTFCKLPVNYFRECR